MEKRLKRKNINFFLIGIFLLMFSACGSKEKENEIVIRVATVTSDNSPVCKALFEFERILEERSNGRMKVEVYPSGQLGTETEVLDMTRRGDIQMSTNNPLNFSSAIPQLSVMNLYFLFDDFNHAIRALDSQAGKMILDAYGSMHLEGVGFFPSGFSSIANNSHPINNVEDLKGLKIRGFNPIQIAAWEELGCNLSSVAWNELFTALQQNLIDGGQLSLVGLYEGKFYEVQSYYSAINHQFVLDTLVASERWLETLSSEDEKLIKESINQAISYQRDLVVKMTNNLSQELSDKYGTKINEVSQDVRLQMNEITSPVIAPFVIKSCGEDFYNEFIKNIKKVK